MTARLLHAFRSCAFCCLLLSLHCEAQQPDLSVLNRNKPLLDAHNCYPYEGRWADRIMRALETGLPVAIEQDVAWYVDPATKVGRAVVSHKPETDGSEPALRDYFFERVRPIIEKALRENDRTRWPLIVVHFDFKDNGPALLRAVWTLLGDYEAWITTAPKSSDPHKLSALEVKPLLVLTEDADAQEQVFFSDIREGAKLRLFGSAHTHAPATKDKQELAHLIATLPPQQLLPEPPTNYRRWWNNSWHEVEEGGQQKARDWTQADDARLRALVDWAHRSGYWIRFYTLDGFTPELGRNNGWFESYNFGSLAAAQLRWNAAIRAGVDLIATDQFEELKKVMKTEDAAAHASH